MKTLVALSALLASLAGPVSAASEGRIVTQALAGHGDRFIELKKAGGTHRFVNIAAAQTVVYGESAIEVRPRGAGARALRYEFAGSGSVAPQGIKDSGITYNFFVGLRENWVTGLKSYSQVAYRGVWNGIDATYSGDHTGIKYHFDVAPGADAKKVAFVVRGAEAARITGDGAIEWTVAGVRLRDEPPVAFQSRAGADAIVPASFNIAKMDDGAWRVSFELADYDKGIALTIDPAWTAYTGLVGGNAADHVYGVARDAAGNTYACGATASTDLPATGGALDATYNGGGADAFMIKMLEPSAPSVVSYFGGNGFDVCTGIAVHGDGTIFLSGGTTSTDLSLVGAADANFRRTKAGTDRDAFVVRLNGTGNVILYSGVIGGASDDQASAIAVDSLGRAYVTGYTKSSGFPTAAVPSSLNGAMDAFIARVAANGSTLEYSGFIGGNGNNEAGWGIAVAGDFTAYVVGETDSTVIPALPGSFRTAAGSGTADGFVATISPSGLMTHYVVLTGTSTAASQTLVDRALGVAIASNGNLVVVGETDSGHFPANDAGVQLGVGETQLTPSGNMDGFVMRIASDLSSVISYSYIGGTRFDSAEAVATDFLGDVYVTGSTSNPGTPTGFLTLATPGLRTTSLGQQDGFLARALSSAPAFRGFVGTGANDAVHAIATTGDHILALGGATWGKDPFANTSNPALSDAYAFANGMVLRVNLFGTSGDINYDFKSDLLWRNISTGQIWRMFMNGFTYAGGAIVYTEPNTAWKVVGDADFNGDGLTDLLWRNTSTGQVFLLPFGYNGTVAGGGAFVYTEPNAAWKIVATPDLDGDGMADILWWNSTTGQVYAQLMNGFSITSAGFVYTEPNTAWSIVAVGDFSGSGKRNQLLWRNSATGDVFLMTVTANGGAFTQTGQMIYSEPNLAWKIVAAADFNGDGRTDILYRNDATGQVYILLMNGPSIAGAAQVYSEANLDWKIVAVGDYNGDGRADILYRNFSTGQVYLLLMNGLSITGAGFVYTEPNLSWHVLGPYEYAQ